MVHKARALFIALRRFPISLFVRLASLHAVKSLARIPLRFSYSQTGEDLIQRFYIPDDRGIYVDVGANDPIKYSNTFSLYQRGWHGITIDANERLIARHRRIRKRDIAVCAAVSNQESPVTFHRSASDLVSTIDDVTLAVWKTKWTFRPEDRIAMTTKTLTNILWDHPQISSIDLLCIDVEGHELAVLEGLDFATYRPRMIIVEIHEFKTLFVNPIYTFLTERGYTLVGHITMNAYFMAENAERPA